MNAALNRISGFDRFLGDPASNDTIFSDENAIRLDMASTFPNSAVSILDDYGLQRLYVPREFGGDLDDVLEPMLAIRHVARRDLTVAVAHGKTFLGAVCAWVDSGNLAHHLAPMVLSGAPVSWGLTEKGRGSDLLHTATQFDIHSHKLDGGKWPINNATRGQVMCVLARTADSFDPRSLSLVLADKSELMPRSFQHQPKVITHGVRGADISGITWSNARLPEGRILGHPGHGLEIVLRALQVTRVACTALSLGAADRALSHVLAFLMNRKLYGTNLSTMAAARAEVGSMCADVLLAEAASLAGARHIGALTEELSLVSSLVKYVVPATVDGVFRDSTQFLGARSQLIGFGGLGNFEKAARDSRVVGIFDGNSVVNLQAVINQFPSVVRSSQKLDASAIARIIDPGEEAMHLRLTDLKLVSRGGSTLLASVEELAAHAESKSDLRLTRVVRVYVRAVAQLLNEIRSAPRTSSPSYGYFDLAHRLSFAFAGSCALALAFKNSAASELAKDELWLTAVLHRVCVRLGYSVDGAYGAYTELTDRICRRDDAVKVVSLIDGWSRD